MLPFPTAAVDPGFAKGGGPWRKTGVPDGAPSGVQMEPPAGSSVESGAESFLSIFIQKKWPKVKDLNESLPSCLRQTALRSHDQPQVLVSGQWAVHP